MVTNDLDFVYATPATSSDASGSVELRCTFDVSNFFSKGGNHVVMAVDTSGAAGGNNPHCGPIYRRGANLFTNARGFILFADGTINTEHWNGTASPSIATVVAGGFNVSANPVFTIRLRAGYRAGLYANTMVIEIRAGSGIYGTLLCSGQVSWGWDWTGTHTACVGGIAMGFVSPNQTGCSEQIVARSAPSATIGVSGLQVIAY